VITAPHSCAHVATAELRLLGPEGGVPSELGGRKAAEKKEMSIVNAIGIGS
jgi:hypothetical protein